MAIHAATLKKANKAGIQVMARDEAPAQFTDGATEAGLVATPDQRWLATYKRQYLYGVDAKFLIADMFALIQAEKTYPSFVVDICRDSTVNISVTGTDIEVTGFRPRAALDKAVALWMESRSELDHEDEEADQEAQAEIDAEVEDRKGDIGSVVADRYRAKYKEAGDATSCNDWLAATLNEMCRTKSGTDIELFEKICGLNGVNLSKLNRESRGWQGRFRMTGRNMLAKVVFRAGELRLPVGLGQEFNDDYSVLKVDHDWKTGQRFKQEAK